MPTRFQNSKTKTKTGAISRSKQIAWFLLGLTALILGGLGVFLPILPTTPFIILAAFAFGKSFPAWQRWLANNKTFGPIIRDWEQTGAIAPRYKAIASIMMLAALALSFYLSFAPVVIAIQALCMVAAFYFIITRPNGTL